jgi:hypothetical protein
MAEDIRWQQRFSNYRKALERLEDFLEPPALNEREQQELIIKDRNLTSHSYLPCFQQLSRRLKLRVLEEQQ